MKTNPLTAKKIERLRPRDTQYEVRDGKMPGLLVRVNPTGAKRWCFRARQDGRLRLITLGGFPDLSVEAARRRARQLRVDLDQGKRPADDRRKRRQAPTVGELWDEYLERHVLPRKAASSQRDDKSRYRRHVSGWASTKAADIQKKDVTRLLAKVARNSGPVESNRTLALIRHLYEWSRREGLIECENPARDAKPLAEKKHRFALDKKSLDRLVSSIAQESDPLWQGYFLLLLTTGLRRAELLGARWEWVHLDHDPPVIVFPAGATKQRQEHVIPLSKVAHQVVEQLPSKDRSPFLFPSETAAGGHRMEPKTVWHRVRRRAGLPDMRIHDLRHAVGSALGSSGAAAHVIQNALGHAQTATTDRYVHPHLPAVRDALEGHGASVEASLVRAKKKAAA